MNGAQLHQVERSRLSDRGHMCDRSAWWPHLVSRIPRLDPGSDNLLQIGNYLVGATPV